LNTFVLLAQPPTKPFRKLTAGRIGLYVELPVADRFTRDEGDYAALIFVHHDARRRKRLDLYLTPSTQPKHFTRA
jgi:hypothetical protein